MGQAFGKRRSTRCRKAWYVAMLVVALPFPSLLLFGIINYQKISENKIYLMMSFKKFDHFFHMISVKSLEKNSNYTCSRCKGTISSTKHINAKRTKFI